MLPCSAFITMRETTPSAMPPCFDRWCKRSDDLLKTKAQKREFRHYIGGLLGESKRKKYVSDGVRLCRCELPQITPLS